MWVCGRDATLTLPLPFVRAGRSCRSFVPVVHANEGDAMTTHVRQLVSEGLLVILESQPGKEDEVAPPGATPEPTGVRRPIPSSGPLSRARTGAGATRTRCSWFRFPAGPSRRSTHRPWRRTAVASEVWKERAVIRTKSSTPLEHGIYQGSRGFATVRATRGDQRGARPSAAVGRRSTGQRPPTGRQRRLGADCRQRDQPGGRRHRLQGWTRPRRPRPLPS